MCLKHLFLENWKSVGLLYRYLTQSNYACDYSYNYGLSGVQVYVCGTYPHWIFTSDRGTLQLHPMTIDGPALSFAPFNNVNCRQGFLYFNSEVCMCVPRSWTQCME